MSEDDGAPPASEKLPFWERVGVLKTAEDLLIDEPGVLADKGKTPLKGNDSKPAVQSPCIDCSYRLY